MLPLCQHFLQRTDIKAEEKFINATSERFIPLPKHGYLISPFYTRKKKKSNLKASNNMAK